MNDTSVRAILRRTKEFRRTANEIFGDLERSQSRVFSVSQSYDFAAALNLKQSEMLKQALKCCEFGIFRGAHVLAWGAKIDYLQEWLAEDGFSALNVERSAWKITSLEDLRDRFPEYAHVEAIHGLGWITKAEKKAFHGMLSKRNECAHPSDYYPNLNETLGYISEIMNRTDSLETKRRAKKS